MMLENILEDIKKARTGSWITPEELDEQIMRRDQGLCPDCGWPAIYAWEGIGYCKDHWEQYQSHIAQMKIEAITEQHRKSLYGDWCQQDQAPWPCAAAELLIEIKRLRTALQEILATDDIGPVYRDIAATALHPLN